MGKELMKNKIFEAVKPRAVLPPNRVVPNPKKVINKKACRGKVKEE